MTLEDFSQSFASLFAPEIAATIDADSEFKKLSGWNSLRALVVIAHVEDEYDVLLKGDDIFGARTVRDLFDIVSARKN